MASLSSSSSRSTRFVMLVCLVLLVGSSSAGRSGGKSGGGGGKKSRGPQLVYGKVLYGHPVPHKVNYIPTPGSAYEPFYPAKPIPYNPYISTQRQTWAPRVPPPNRQVYAILPAQPHQQQSYHQQPQQSYHQYHEQPAYSAVLVYNQAPAQHNPVSYSPAAPAAAPYTPPPAPYTPPPAPYAPPPASYAPPPASYAPPPAPYAAPQTHYHQNSYSHPAPAPYSPPPAAPYSPPPAPTPYSPPASTSYTSAGASYFAQAQSYTPPAPAVSAPYTPSSDVPAAPAAPASYGDTPAESVYSVDSETGDGASLKELESDSQVPSEGSSSYSGEDPALQEAGPGAGTAVSNQVDEEGYPWTPELVDDVHQHPPIPDILFYPITSSKNVPPRSAAPPAPESSESESDADPLLPEKYAPEGLEEDEFGWRVR